MASARLHSRTASRPAGPLARSLLLACLVIAAAVYAPSGALAKLTAANWDKAEQRQVVKAGLMSEAPAGFEGAAPLTAQAANEALTALAARESAAEAEQQPSEAGSQAPTPVTQTATVAQGTMTLTHFDALLVEQLGLGQVAAHVQQVASAAGLRPPSYFGSEVLARYLGLRYNHPSGEDGLELYPWNTITRAEAAHSFAVVLGQGSWAVQSARETFAAFSLPHYSPAQLRVLRVAVSKIGMPYVWAGTTDGSEDGLEHGGYDCSGFAWRVYKVSGLPWGRSILGRTAAQQGGEIPKSRRIRLAEVQGGDLLFFGSAHFNSTATEANVDHEGIALSNEWAIHSSSQGVYVLPLYSGWLAQQFAWARRVL